MNIWAWTMTLMCLLTFRWNSMTLWFRRAVELKPGPPTHHDLGHFWKSDLFGSSVIWFSWSAEMEQRCRAETDTTHYLSSCLRHEHKVSVIVGNEQVIEDLNWHHRSHNCHYQGLSGEGCASFIPLFSQHGVVWRKMSLRFNLHHFWTI